MKSLLSIFDVTSMKLKQEWPIKSACVVHSSAGGWVFKELGELIFSHLETPKVVCAASKADRVSQRVEDRDIILGRVGAWNTKKANSLGFVLKSFEKNQ